MKKPQTWLALFATLIVLVVVLPRLLNQATPLQGEVPYSEFKVLVASGTVESISLSGNQATSRLSQPLEVVPGRPVHRIVTYLPEISDPAFLPLLEKHGVEITGQPSTDGRSGLMSLLPWFVLIAVYIWFWSRMQQTISGRFGGRGPQDFLAGSAKTESRGKPPVTFDDVAGQENAKKEVVELVEFLRAPDRYRAMGAEPPRGVLLMGPPGTGKTLLARALAGEAGVAFYHTSASSFIELYVGVGASRVRQMFDEAKKRAPAIIFIDELDAVGRVRGTGLGGGNDEREQTLNQILSEMDGFSGREAVVVLAATNRPDVLDPALLRPGRFDRHVTLELPDRPARVAILKVHCRKVPLADDVDLELIAKGTPGFSGADIKNLVNEAAMAAARAGAKAVTAAHFDAMRDKILMGTARSLAILPEEKHRLAVHEAGHTAAAFFLPNADPLYKVTIIPRGRSLGATHMLPEEERHTLPEDYLKDRLAVALAGRVAERLILGTLSSGADDDIQRATQLARAMAGRWGMAPEVGPVDLRQSEDHPFLGREIAQPRRFSETTAHAVDEAVAKLLREAEETAAQILRGHRAGVEALIARLEERESLDRAEIDACLGADQAMAQSA